MARIVLSGWFAGFLAGVIAAGLDAALALYCVLVRGQRLAIHPPILSQCSVVIRGERNADIIEDLLTLMYLVLHDSFNFVDLIDPPARIPLCDSQNWASLVTKPILLSIATEKRRERLANRTPVHSYLKRNPERKRRVAAVNTRSKTTNGGRTRSASATEESTRIHDHRSDHARIGYRGHDRDLYSRPSGDAQVSAGHQARRTLARR
jgi:hypothetical protein